MPTYLLSLFGAPVGPAVRLGIPNRYMLEHGVILGDGPARMRQWDDTEGTRDNAGYPLLARIHDEHASLVDVGPGSAVLDIGCGRNPITIPDARVVGLDPDARLLKGIPTSTRLEGPIRGVGKHLPFPDEAFQSVFLRGIVHHLDIDQRQRTFSEIERVLQPDGELLVVEPDPTSRLRQVVWTVARLVGYEHEESPYVDDIGYANPHDVAELCANAGLEVTEKTWTGSIVSPLAFLYPWSFGIGGLDAIRRWMPAKWWFVCRARRPTRM